MRKIFVVINREFIERVRNKWFVISTIIGPILMAAVIALPFIMASRGGRDRNVVVVDATSTQFGDRLVAMLRSPAPIESELLRIDLSELDDVGDSLAQVVGERTVDGFLIVTDQTTEDGRAEYRGSNVTSQVDMSVIRRILREAVLTARLSDVGVDPQLVARATIPVDLQTVSVRGGEVTEQSGEATFFVAYLVWFLLYFAILVYGVQVMGAVVEEKSSRVVEVLVSSLKPFQLLSGKVIGVGAVGLFQLAIWLGAGWLLLKERTRLAGLFGVEMGNAETFAFPEVPLITIVIILSYFILGYFLYAAMFAAIGALSITEAEARQAQTPVVMLLVIPSIMSLISLQTADSGLAFSLSVIPFSSPIAMPVRWAAADVSELHVAMSLAILALTLVFVTWIAGRIYRIGILMHGKRPSPKEVWRMLRAA